MRFWQKVQPLHRQCEHVGSPKSEHWTQRFRVGGMAHASLRVAQVASPSHVKSGHE